MFLNLAALIGSKVSTMALGFVSWLVAARLFAPTEVGLASAAVSAMMLCTQIAILGVGSAVIVLLPQHIQNPSRLLNTAFSIVGSAALVASGLSLMLISSFSQELKVVSSTPIYMVLFLVVSGFGTLGILFDQVAVAQRRGYQALMRGIVSGTITISLIALLPLSTGVKTSQVIFSAWALGGLGACTLGVTQLRRSLADYHYRPALETDLARRLLAVGLPNWALTIVERAPALIMPIMVTEFVSPETNAYWYAVWMMAWVVFIVPIQVGLTLFAEIARRPDALSSIIRHGVRSSLVIGVAGAAVLAVLAPLALSLLGSSYAAAGSQALRVLVVGVIPLTFTQAYFAASRATGRLTEAILTGLVVGIASVCLAPAAGIKYGLVGMAMVWVAIQSIAGLWGLLRLRST